MVRSIVFLLTGLLWAVTASAFDIHHWVAQELIMPEEAAIQDAQSQRLGYLGIRLNNKADSGLEIPGIEDAKQLPVRAINEDWCEFARIEDYPAVLERARRYAARYNRTMAEHLDQQVARVLYEQ